MLGMVVLSIAVTKSVDAATTDTFNITITIGYLEITLKDSTAGGAGGAYPDWAMGAKAVNTAYAMVSGATGAMGEGIYVEVGLSSAYTLTAQITTPAATWTNTAGTDDTTASNQYLLTSRGAATAVCPVMTIAGGASKVIAASATQIVDVAGTAATDTYLYFGFKTPTATTTGVEQSITVTVAIVAA